MPGLKYYSPEGEEVDSATWVELMKDKVVARSTLADGKVVSTVWLGLDHGDGDGPPLIFESMTFSDKGSWLDIDCERYTTRDEAVAGHAAMVEKWTRRIEEGEQ